MKTKRTVTARVVLGVEVDYDEWCRQYGNESVEHVRAYLRSNVRIAASELVVQRNLLVGVTLLNARSGDW